MGFSIAQLRSFVAVVDHGSYTKAARALFLSQPGVYQHVRHLEKETGTRLVEQHGKQVVVTQHGRALYDFAKRLQAEEQDLLDYFHDDQTLQRGQVRAAAGTTAGEFILPRIAVAFRRRYPGIALSVAVLGTPEDIDEGVAQRRFDIAVHSCPDDVRGVQKTAFLDDELVGIAPPGHPLAQLNRPVRAEVVAREPLVTFGFQNPHLFRDPAVIQQLADGWFRAMGVHVESKLVIGTLQGMKTAVRAGAGVALVSKHSVRDDDMSLATFQLANPPRRSFYVVRRDGGWESQVVRTFREFAESLEWLEDSPVLEGSDAP